MSKFTEFIVEDAALDWLKELGCEIGLGPGIEPGESAAGHGVLGDALPSKLRSC